MKWFVFLLCLFCIPSLPVHADDSGQKVTYWFAETDTTGWTWQNADIDNPIYIGTSPEQPSGVKNIALNDVVLRDGKLERPTDPRQTRIIHYPQNVADQYLLSNLPSYGSTIKTLSILIADHVVDRAEMGIADTITVKRTVVDSSGLDVTTPIAGFRRD